MPSNVTSDLEERIKQHLPRSRDPILVIIKGHLLIEECLHGIIENTLRDASRLPDARLTFHQAVCLCEAICGHPKGSLPWAFVRRLNEVRNRLAHRLDHDDVDALVDSLIHSYDGDTSVVPSSPSERIRWLKNTIMIVCGMLDGFRLQQAFTKEEMEHEWRQRHGITNCCS